MMFLIMHPEPFMLERAMAMGVAGYVLKDAALAEIVEAVRTVAMCRTYLSPAFSDYLVGCAFHRPRGSTPASSLLSTLTECERQILRMIAESQTSKEVADALGMPYPTVENQRATISQKPRLHGSHALVKFFFEHRLEL
jgi:two-component system response regulator DegU